MIDRIKRWLTPPQFPGDEEKTRRASLINLALLTMGAMTALILLANLLGGKSAPLLMGVEGAIVIFCVGLSVWMRHGDLKSVSVVGLAAGFGFITLGSGVLGTIRTPTTALYFMLILTGGLLFDRRGIIITTLLSSLAVAGLIWAENAGLLPRPEYAVTATQWITYTGVFGIIGGLSFLGLQSTRKALARADQEIAERKRAEFQREATLGSLRESEEKYRGLVQGSPDAIAIYLDGQIVFANAATVQLLRARQVADLMGRSVIELIHSEDREFVAQRMIAAQQASQPLALAEEKFLRLDGTAVEVEVIAIPITFDRRPAVQIIARDITERKQAEEQLRQLSRAVEQSPASIVITDPTGAISYVNPKFSQVTGYSLAEALGQNPRILKSDHTAPAEYAGLWQTISAGQTWRGEFLNKKKNGELYWELASISPITDAAGRVTHYLAVKEDITERKQTEAALRESQSLYHSLVEVSPLSICRKDRAGRFTFANRHFLEVSNITLADLVGQTDFELHPPKLAEKYRCDDRAVMDSRQAREFIEERALLGGESTVIQSYKTPIYDGAGNINGVQISFLDITDRQRTEDALRESQSLYHSLVEVSPLSICRKDRAGRFTFANRRFLEASNITLADLVGQTDFELHPPELAEKYQSDDRAVMDSGQVWEVIESRAVKGGKSIVIQTIKVPIYDGAGKINGVQISFWDITDRQRAEETLRRQHDFLTALHDTALDLLNRHQMSELLQTVVERAAVILDAPYGELMLAEGDELVVQACTPNQASLTGERTSRGEALLSWQAHDTGQPAILDDYSAWPNHRAVYDIVPLRAVADFPIMAGQNCLGVLGLGRTQPDQPFTPEEIQQGRLFSQLAALVLDNASLYASALHELTERKQAEAALRESNAELQIRNEELDAFAHTVAHDLKNPLGVMMGYAELLVETDGALPTEMMQQALAAIYRSGRKSSDIIGSLLLLASVRKQDVQAEPLDMAHIVDEVLLRLTDSIRDSGADLHVLDRASWPGALGYAPWIEEIWVNYLSNALKYGGPQPRIDLDAACQPDGSIRFSVRDYGPGLTPEQQARLFAPFERLGQARVEGHGLGLSVVRRIADKLGGQVGVDSQPGQGSAFYFTLPAA